MSGSSDLPGDHLLGKPRAALRVCRRLLASQLDVLGGLTQGESLQPPAAAQPQHRNPPREALPQCLGADLDPSEHRQLRHVQQTPRGELLLLQGDLEASAADTDEGAGLGDVHRQLVRVAGHQPARWLLAARQQRVGLVRQAQPNQRTARALGTVNQGQWRGGPIGHSPRVGDQVGRPAQPFRRQLHPHPLAGLGVPQLGVIALVALLTQQQRLQADLHLVAGPRRPVGLRRSLLVVHRHDVAAVAFDQVEFGDHPEPLGTHRDRTGPA